MGIRWHGLRAAKALIIAIALLSLTTPAARGQGYPRCCPSCNGQAACGCNSGYGGYSSAGGSIGEPGSANAGAPTANQLADAPFDLGEAGPAQIGSSFAAVDSAYIDDA